MVARKVRAAIAQPIFLRGLECRVTASMGIALESSAAGNCHAQPVHRFGRGNRHDCRNRQTGHLGNKEDRAITDAIIALAKTLSLTVVAEGVETQGQEAFLREHECHESQGYYFSGPASAAQLGELWRKHVHYLPTAA